MEIWKDIEGYNGIYQVSNYGNVKSLDRQSFNKGNLHKIKGKLLKPSYAGTGYKRVILCHTKSQKYFYVHRLVLIAFTVFDNERNQVNHINGIKSDNRLSNLEWCSRSENMNHAYLFGLKTITKNQLDATSKKVFDENTGIVYNSIKEVSLKFNINYSTLRSRILYSNKQYNFKLI